MGVQAVRFNRRPRLGRHQKQRFRRVNHPLHRLRPRRQSRVQQQQLRKTRLTAASTPQHFRPQAAPAHPQQNHMTIAGRPYFLGKRRQLPNAPLHLPDNPHPPQAIHNLRRRLPPHPIIPFPNAGHHPVGVQLLQRRRHCRGILPQSRLHPRGILPKKFRPRLYRCHRLYHLPLSCEY